MRSHNGWIAVCVLLACSVLALTVAIVNGDNSDEEPLSKKPVGYLTDNQTRWPLVDIEIGVEKGNFFTNEDNLVAVCYAGRDGDQAWGGHGYVVEMQFAEDAEDEVTDAPLVYMKDHLRLISLHVQEDWFDGEKWIIASVPAPGGYPSMIAMQRLADCGGGTHRFLVVFLKELTYDWQIKLNYLRDMANRHIYGDYRHCSDESLAKMREQLNADWAQKAIDVETVRRTQSPTTQPSRILTAEEEKALEEFHKKTTKAGVVK